MSNAMDPIDILLVMVAPPFEIGPTPLDSYGTILNCEASFGVVIF